jgi:hypothetical protein
MFLPSSPEPVRSFAHDFWRANVPRAPASGGFAPGTRVRIRGLVGRPELNGAAGAVAGCPVLDSGRVPVRPDAAPERQLAIRAENLALDCRQAPSHPSLPGSLLACGMWPLPCLRRSSPALEVTEASAPPFALVAFLTQGGSEADDRADVALLQMLARARYARGARWRRTAGASASTGRRSIPAADDGEKWGTARLDHQELVAFECGVADAAHTPAVVLLANNERSDVLWG